MEKYEWKQKYGDDTYSSHWTNHISNGLKRGKSEHE